VLLVEDDPLVRDAMARLMEDWGLRFRACADGDELLAVLDAEPETRWHAVLDYRLPGPETGLDIADRIRARPDPPPVTLLTGEADPAVQADALARGIQVLRKPLRPLRLRAALLAGNRPPVAASG
ncbi:MAG: response regulator, partial [Rhodocyclaceae bacterium]|nr:response regulator [Rhodocyclaceae bacterium]